MAFPLHSLALKALPAKAGLLGGGERYGLAIDGRVLPATPAAIVDAVLHTRVPVLLGATADQGTVFVGDANVQTAAQYEAYVRVAFKSNAPAVLARYPASAYPTPLAALAALLTDGSFTCPARTRARTLAKHGPAAFQYEFTHVTQAGQQLRLGAWHGSELEFVFGTLRDRQSAGVPPAELALADAMMGYWAQFARSGTPSAPGAPQWAPFTASSEPYLNLGTPPTTGDRLKRDACDFWGSLLEI